MDRRFQCGPCARNLRLVFPDLVYEYRGHPDRGYHDICNLLQRSLADPTKRYAYALHIKEILVSGDLAVVRLIWTLRTTGAGAPQDTVSHEPAMDVFRREMDSSWWIIPIHRLRRRWVASRTMSASRSKEYYVFPKQNY